jgi:hypothetical protein
MSEKLYTPDSLEMFTSLLLPLLLRLPPDRAGVFRQAMPD